jgi:predicted dehydrogenase
MANGAILAATFCGVGRYGGEPNMVEIYGSEGTLRYLAGLDAPGSGKILFGKRIGSALEEYVIPASEEAGWQAEADFINAVRSGKRDPEPSFLDGLRYMEVTDAIFQSVSSGRAVGLPLG